MMVTADRVTCRRICEGMAMIVRILQMAPEMLWKCSTDPG